MARRASSILKLLWPKPRASAQHDIRGLPECRFAYGLARKRRLGARVAPRLMCDTAQRQAGSLDAAVRELERSGNRDERKRVGQAIADFQIGVVAGKAGRRQLDRNDDLARFEVVVALGRVAGQAMELVDRNRARPVRAGYMYLGLEQRQGDAHVGGLHRAQVRRGLVAAMVMPHLLRHVGERTARWLLLTGELIDGVDALRFGLVNAVASPEVLLDTAAGWCRSLAEGGPKGRSPPRRTCCGAVRGRRCRWRNWRRRSPSRG